MNSRRFEKTLARWESGELAVTDLEARYPDRDVSGLVLLHAQLTSLGQEPVPDPEPSWRALERQLPERLPASGELSRNRLRRPVILALAAALLLIPMAALASQSPVIQKGVSNIVRFVGDVLEGSRGDQESPPPTFPDRDLEVYEREDEGKGEDLVDSEREEEDSEEDEDPESETEDVEDSHDAEDEGLEDSVER